MPQTETRSFKTYILLSHWLTSKLIEAKNVDKFSLDFFSFKVMREDEQIHLLIEFLGTDSNGAFHVPGPGTVEVDEKTLADFKGHWNSCRADMPIIPHPAFESEIITYSVACFLKRGTE